MKFTFFFSKKPLMARFGTAFILLAFTDFEGEEAGLGVNCNRLADI